MLAFLSPAKTFTTKLTPPISDVSQPLFVSQSSGLIDILKKKTPSELQKLMKVSENISHLNYERYSAWDVMHTDKNAYPSLFYFFGDVYRGLNVENFSAQNVHYAQDHLCVFSGLYGVLRPLDLMQPYRLEMGTKLENSAGKNLYEYWSETVTEYVENHSAPMIVNLASEEYSKVLDRKKLTKPVIDCVFKQKKDGKEPRIIAIYAKRARGLMASYMMQNEVQDIQALSQFAEEGYRFEVGESTNDQLVFVKEV